MCHPCGPVSTITPAGRLAQGGFARRPSMDVQLPRAKDMLFKGPLVTPVCSRLLWSPGLSWPPQGQLRSRVALRAALVLRETKVETARPRIHLSDKLTLAT